jgi:hypothetical protein
VEYLEDKFCRKGLLNSPMYEYIHVFDHQAETDALNELEFINAGFPDPFYVNLKEISSVESTHVSFLTKALGSAALAECTKAFPSTTATEFVALASIFESVGVSAYVSIQPL